jgi:hypothetical protein
MFDGLRGNYNVVRIFMQTRQNFVISLHDFKAAQWICGPSDLHSFTTEIDTCYFTSAPKELCGHCPISAADVKDT